MNTVTVRAKLVEGINPNTDEGFPAAVTVTGGKFLTPGAVMQIAQQAVSTIYIGYLATINFDEWDAYQTNDKPSFTAKVVKL